MEYYHQLANDIYENRESYNSLQYIEIFKLLKENYDFANGISCDGNGHKQTPSEMYCDGCGVDMNDMHDDPVDGLCINCCEDGRCERCDEIGILMYSDSLCSWCSDEIEYSI
tara:strand:+ start:375 stop:710 length:336 start_codon:yes stop_codon:yes gene_type:complete